jgi:hypothetical protein
MAESAVGPIGWERALMADRVHILDMIGVGFMDATGPARFSAAVGE